MLRIFRAKRRAFVIWLFVLVAFFLGGFIVIPGSGLNTQSGNPDARNIGDVEGLSISRVDFDMALAVQQENYRAQFKSDPPERDQRALEVQAWRSLVSQNLLAREANKLDLKAYDPEIVLSLRTSPPPQLTSLPAFQTDGKFDPSKYQAALNDPNINWGPFEELMRGQLPVRKLQERLLTSIKMSEPELREAYRDRFERVGATIVVVPPATDSTVPTPSEDELHAVYERHRDRFAYPPRAQLEVLLVPKEFGESDVREAQQLAQSLADRARAGEDFAALARDYSEGTGSNQGGEVDRTLRIADFGPTAGAMIAALQPGQLSDAVRDGGRFLVFKLLRNEPIPGSGETGYRVAQVVIRIRASDQMVRDQYATMTAIRQGATRGGLGKAAASRGLVTGRTSYYTISDSPPELFTIPAAADWGLNAKKGALSPIFDGTDEYALVEVVDRQPGGPAAMEEARPQLTPIFEQEKRIAAAQSVADGIAQALAAGGTLEQATQAAGLTATPLDGIARAQLPPSLASVPEVAGAIFATEVGKVVGPIRTLNGWYFARVDRITPADPELFDQIKGQISNDMLQRRQQSFLNTYLSEMRVDAKVKDLRFPQ